MAVMHSTLTTIGWMRRSMPSRWARPSIQHAPLVPKSMIASPAGPMRFSGKPATQSRAISANGMRMVTTGRRRKARSKTGVSRTNQSTTLMSKPNAGGSNTGNSHNTKRGQFSGSSGLIQPCSSITGTVIDPSSHNGGSSRRMPCPIASVTVANR
jgi:hypothetical protein